MNVLIVTGHPAQVHNFKCVKYLLEERGHKVFWLSSNKDISFYLLKKYGIDYGILHRPKKKDNVFSLAITLLKNIMIVIRCIRKNRINFVISRIDPGAVMAAWILRKKQIAFSDTESAGIYDAIFSKFIGALLTSSSFKRQLRKDQIRFSGNIELFYLHPNWFRHTESGYSLLNIEEGTPYVIMRYVSWDAYHDKGIKGFSDNNKLVAVEEFSKYAKVYISSEVPLPTLLEPYRINIMPEKIHHVLKDASLCFGESPTMSSESVVLGTPAVFFKCPGLGYVEDEQDAGLLHIFHGEMQIQAINKGVEFLANDVKKSCEYIDKHRVFMSDKIDVTAFTVWFIENYPQSKRIMRANPDYQYKFR